jgi:hypothetical protein
MKNFGVLRTHRENITEPVYSAAKMSTKISTAKSTKETKETTVRLSEEDKRTDPDNYIINSGTGKYVKRDSPMGKKLVKAEETGEDVAKTMTETDRLIKFIQTLIDQLDLEDSAIKAAFVGLKDEMPRGFPNAWGGKQKTAPFPGHPKRPNNPYIFFTKAVRESTVLANPDVGNTGIVSIMAKQWNETAEEDRVEYYEAAAADKLRYEEEMVVFETEHPDQARAKSSPGDGKPTKETAYHLFQVESREYVQTEFPDLDGKQITKKLAEMWDELKKDNKEKVADYQAEAEKANEDFEERVKDYHNSPNSSPKLSKGEQAKANDPEHYDLNTETDRYVLKEGWKKNPDGSFVKSVKKEVASPTTTKGKPVSKPKTAKATATKPVEKKAVKKTETKAKKVEEPVIAKVEENDDDLLIED